MFTCIASAEYSKGGYASRGLTRCSGSMLLRVVHLHVIHRSGNECQSRVVSMLF